MQGLKYLVYTVWLEIITGIKLKAHGPLKPTGHLSGLKNCKYVFL